MKAGCIQNALLAAALLFGLGGSAVRHDNQPQYPDTDSNSGVGYELPQFYDAMATPWLTNFDAASIVKHYTNAGHSGLVVHAWPWLNMFCAPTLYPRWETLSDEIKLASVDRQELCNEALEATTVSDFATLRIKAQAKMEFARSIWGQGSPENGKYMLVLGGTFEELPPKVVDHGVADTPEAAVLWLSRQMNRRNSNSPSMWSSGRTVGPFTPVSTWKSAWQPTALDGDIDEQQAVDIINKMAAKRGLLGLRLPLGWASTPAQWVEAARRIDRVAGLIEKRSRTQGGGFGMWGNTLLDWRIPEKTELQALTVRYGNFSMIQAQQESIAHEWFHTFQYWLQANGLDWVHNKLLDDISTMRYTKAQVRTIFAQSHKVLDKNQAARAWVQALNGQQDIWQPAWLDESQGRNAYWYAQAAWTLAPKLEADENHWIARRRILEETLTANGWSGVGIVQPGYYTQPTELSAAAFQGDINLLMHNDGLLKDALPDNLVSAPLPIESIAMRGAFSNMFAEIKRQRRLAQKQSKH